MVRINKNQFRSAVGDTPVAFDWIKEQNLRCIPMTGIHSTVPHGLSVGDRVEINVTSGNWQLSGVYGVQAIQDVETGEHAGSLIVIHQLMYEGLSSASGTWKRVVPGPASTTEPLRPYVGQITGCCPTGYHHPPYNNDCVPDTVPCQQGYTLVNGTCVPDTTPCLVGYHKNEFGVCVRDACATGTRWDAATNKCVPNDTGCGANQELIGGKCVDKCPTGYSRNEYGACYLSSCPPGQEMSWGKCMTPCPSGKVHDYDGNCVYPVDPLTGCPSNQVRDEFGNCVNKAGLNLPSWAIWVGIGLVSVIGLYSILKKK